jgi:hypothetical protein
MLDPVSRGKRGLTDQSGALGSCVRARVTWLPLLVILYELRLNLFREPLQISNTWTLAKVTQRPRTPIF